MTQIDISLTAPQLHEVVTALHRNRAKINQRIRHDERKRQTPEGKEAEAADPCRGLYLDTIATCRASRIETIDDLLEQLEKHEYVQHFDND